MTAAAVLSYYYPQPAMVRRIAPLGNAGGWSGSELWRVSAEGNALRGVPGAAETRDFCLRRWPQEHPTPQRLQFIHATLDRAAAAGLQYVPAPLRTTAGKTFVESDGHLWELTPWIPGVADFRDRPTHARLKAAFAALASFHLATAGNPAAATAPALAERHARLIDLRRQLPPLAAAVHRGLRADLDERAQRVLTLAPPRLFALEMPLQFAAQQQLPLQPAIRDIHHDHVLFTGDEVTGLIDFGAMRVDTPLADVARLLGSLAGDDQANRELALASYFELRPLSPADHHLIDLLDQSTLVLSGLNWLVWLYLDRRDMGDLAPIVQRLDEILARYCPPNFHE